MEGRQEFKAKQHQLKFQFKVDQADEAHELQCMQLELQSEMIWIFRQQSQQPVAANQKDVEGKENTTATVSKMKLVP